MTITHTHLKTSMLSLNKKIGKSISMKILISEIIKNPFTNKISTVHTIRPIPIIENLIMKISYNVDQHKIFNSTKTIGNLLQKLPMRTNHQF